MERPLGPLPHLPSSTTTSSFNNTFVPRTNATITTTTATTATHNNPNTPAMGRGRGRGRTLPAWMTQQSGGGGDGFVGGGQQAHVPANRLTTSPFPVSTASNTHATTTTNATTTNNATTTTTNTNISSKPVRSVEWSNHFDHATCLPRIVQIVQPTSGGSRV